MGADADRDRRGHQVAPVSCQPHLYPVVVLGQQRVVHRLEVGQRARGEVVAVGGVDIEVVEGLEVGDVAPGDLDTGLVGLLDVATPLLVHPGQHLGLGAWAGLLATCDERDLEVELRLSGREAPVDRLRLPAELVELCDHPGTLLRALEGRYVAQSAYGLVRDAGLDLLGRPPTGHDRWSHPDGEGPLGAQVRGERGEPVVEVVTGPVDDRAFGEVGEEALEPGELAIEDEAGTDQLVAAEEAHRLVAPLRLHRPPGGGLQEAG